MDKSRKKIRLQGEIPDVLHPFIEDKNETEGKTLDSIL